MFSGARGGRMDQPDLWRLIRAAARRAGLEERVSAHWLRHACASHAIEGGAPLHLVQQQLGHTSLAVTGRYLHARPQDGLCRYLALESESAGARERG
jgi:integrase/recombinase XerD